MSLLFFVKVFFILIYPFLTELPCWYFTYRSCMFNTSDGYLLCWGVGGRHSETIFSRAVGMNFFVCLENNMLTVISHQHDQVGIVITMGFTSEQTIWLHYQSSLKHPIKTSAAYWKCLAKVKLPWNWDSLKPNQTATINSSFSLQPYTEPTAMYFLK